VSADVLYLALLRWLSKPDTALVPDLPGASNSEVLAAS
jgi:hypothetical protein